MRNLYIIILFSLSFFLSFSLSSSLYSQTELKEVGVRGGYSGGFIFRVTLEEDLSYEGQVNYRDHGAIVTLIRQQHRELGMDKGGNWDFIYGFGAHAGFYFTDRYRVLFRDIYYNRELFTPVVGFDGYMGIDYQLVNVPITFGLSYQPFMEISLKQVFGINLWDFGFNVRYRF